MKMFFLALVCVNTLSLCASEERPADALYAHGEWSAALAAYEKEPDPSAGVLIRMGECAARNKLYSQALRHLYKALPHLYLLAYYNLSLQIRSLMREAGLAVSASLSPQWYLVTVLASVPPLLWQLIALLLLLFGFWRVRLWWRKKQFGILFCVMFGVLLNVILAWWSIAEREFIGGVGRESLVLRSGPDVRFSQVGSLPAGMPVHVAAYLQMPNGPWYCKVVGGKQVGWTLKESINLF